MCARRRAAFFYARPVLRDPSRNGRLVALDGSTFGLLTSPAERRHQSGNVVHVIVNTVVPFDHLDDARTGPQVGRKAIGLRALQEPPRQPLPLPSVQLGRRTGMNNGPYALLASLLEGLPPLGHTGPRRAHTPRGFGLGNPLPNPRHRLSPPALQLRWASMRSHAPYYRQTSACLFIRTGVNTSQARRSDTAHVVCACFAASLRRAGLVIFPSALLPGSACPASDRPPPSSAGGFRSPAP